MCDKFSQKSGHILWCLYEVIEQRRQDLPQNSYTTSLFNAGIEKISAKFSEESEELIRSASAISLNGDGEAEKKQMIHEAADFMYHFLVLLVASGISLDDVEYELTRRFGVSGLDEKNTRNKH